MLLVAQMWCPYVFACVSAVSTHECMCVHCHSVCARVCMGVWSPCAQAVYVLRVIHAHTHTHAHTHMHTRMHARVDLRHGCERPGCSSSLKAVKVLWFPWRLWASLAPGRVLWAPSPCHCSPCPPHPPQPPPRPHSGAPLLSGGGRSGNLNFPRGIAFSLHPPAQTCPPPAPPPAAPSFKISFCFPVWSLTRPDFEIC